MHNAHTRCVNPTELIAYLREMSMWLNANYGHLARFSLYFRSCQLTGQVSDLSLSQHRHFCCYNLFMFCMRVEVGLDED